MTLFETITAAVSDFTDRGYVGVDQLAYWLGRIREAAESQLMPPHELADVLNRSLGQIYKRLVDDGQVIKSHPGVSRFTIDNVRPQLRAELNKRMAASADLIKLNREQAIDKTLQRFSGWATSIPAGGSNAVDKNPTKILMQKSMRQLPFEERRVLIDQGHKFTAAVSEIIAKDQGAIALIWHSHWRQPGYNYRKDHKERDGLVYTVRGNWALEAGLMRKGPAGYYDDVTSVGEEPFCRCNAQFVYSLSKLPDVMLAAKGKAELQRVRAAINAAA